MNMALGVTAAIGAGAAFAAGGILQQREAATIREPSLSPRLLFVLVQRPIWLTGIGLDFGSYVLQALALSSTPLAIVQPLVVTEIVFALPVSAWLYGHPLRLRDWAGLLGVALGLAATLWGAAPSVGRGPSSPVRWVGAGAATIVIALLLALVGRRRRPVARATLFAAAASLVLALSAALLALTVDGFARYGLVELARPAPYAMALASLAGLLLVQSAFQSASLVVTLPLLDWLQPLVAVVLGVFVLHETIDTGVLHLFMLGTGAAAALAGLVALNTSPLVARLQVATSKTARPSWPQAEAGRSPRVPTTASACR